LPAYAHNDYENVHPLTDALSLGFRGAEVDLFLMDGALRVGHDRRAARTGGTLEELYLAPLQALVERCGRLTADGRPFFLALELKETSPAAYEALLAALRRYRSLLDDADVAARGPRVTAVLVGWYPSPPASAAATDLPLGWQHRITSAEDDIPPDLDARVRLLSLDYGKTVGRWWRTAAGRRRWLASLRRVKTNWPEHLLRVHNVPVDHRIYAALLAAGVDLIGTEQLAETADRLSRPDISFMRARPRRGAFSPSPARARVDDGARQGRADACAVLDNKGPERRVTCHSPQPARPTRADDGTASRSRRSNAISLADQLQVVRDVATGHERDGADRVRVSARDATAHPRLVGQMVDERDSRAAYRGKLVDQVSPGLCIGTGAIDGRVLVEVGQRVFEPSGEPEQPGPP
jgi:hypothetical protein